MGAQLSRCTSCTTSPAPAVVTAEPVNDVGWWSCCSARPRKPEVRLDNRPERSYGPEAALVVKFRLYREAGDQTGAASLCAEDVVFRVPGKELVGLEAASKEVLSKPATALESEQPLVTTVAKTGEEWRPLPLLRCQPAHWLWRYLHRPSRGPPFYRAFSSSSPSTPECAASRRRLGGATTRRASAAQTP